MKGIVWGRNIDRAKPKLWEIVEDYKRVRIQPTRIVDSKYNAWAEFENGDKWSACGASESQRGHKANIAYIDRAIDEETIHCIILPTICVPPYHAVNYYWVEGDDLIETKVK